ncbi:hypothetical protein Tco_0702685 [Tanacetum coccineum]|uniref:Uncharacterized protein n=1 Tax=Tanacetum coccineum TaxID=301880 RepID=A0ABQ4XWQ3_9ASTR
MLLKQVVVGVLGMVKLPGSLLWVVRLLLQVVLGLEGGVKTKGGVRTIEVSRLEEVVSIRGRGTVGCYHGAIVPAEEKVLPMPWLNRTQCSKGVVVERYACERVGTESDGEGSKQRVEKGLVYPHGIKSIGYGVSWDPVDEETMPRVLMKFHSLTHNNGITRSDVKPEPVVRAQVVPSPVLRRESERIKQIMFNKPPTPGPGLLLEDAMFIK